MNNNYLYQKLLCFLLLSLLTSALAAQTAPKIAIGVKSMKLIMPKGTNPYTNIRFSFQSKNGDMWFATTGAGVYKYDGKVFTNFTKKDGLTDNVVYSIYESKNGKIWFGTNNGVCIYDGIKFTAFHLPGMNNKSFLPDKKWSDLKPSLNSLKVLKTVLSIVGDKNGNIWLGTENMGLYRYNGKTFANFKYNGKNWNATPNDSLMYNDGNYLNGIQTILADKEGNVWFSTIGKGGIFRFDGKTFKDFAESKDLNKAGAFCMLEDRNNNIWFGTEQNGVFKYDGKTITNFNEQDGFCFKNITCITKDKAGNIWFGSTQFNDSGRKEGCITIYNGKIFKRLNTNKLSNTSIWSIYEDKSGYIWLGMRAAQLYRYDGKTFINLSQAN
ncbi:two-component regulator propeller domain-containing protein [Pedobacter aquatilis]|uniref:ligand-binding sensor domain-containing protein n=1 Tax=Pedobacter aquatilis TaxID=351343 RepID=UPI0029318EC9|nr:two-component regulator propeller domain-containing protein [Pedobacter aquatilis]